MSSWTEYFPSPWNSATYVWCASMYCLWDDSGSPSISPLMSNHKEGLLVQGRPVQEMNMHDMVLLKKMMHRPRVRGFTGILSKVCFRYLQVRSAARTVVTQPIPFPPAPYVSVQSRLVSVKWDSTNATTTFPTLTSHWKEYPIQDTCGYIDPLPWQWWQGFTNLSKIPEAASKF